MKSFSCFKPRDTFKNWSKELDKRAATWARKFDSSFKLLLLGPAGTGKTTIMKQMKIIHFEGFSLEERQQKAKEIRANLLESVRELTSSIVASGHQIDWADKDNQTRLDFINGLNLDDQTYELYATKIYDYSKRILTDKGVEELFAKLNQLSITHRSQYLLNRVDEIRNANYVPNNDDILQSKRKTCDIQKLEFQVNLPVKTSANIRQTFCMFDVGGQRGERRKWIQVFDGVSAVMFLIDSSSFDALDDENGRNKLRETINLFHEVWTTRFLLNSNFVLLFNKQDILREKIERGHKIEDHFPEYKLYKYQPQDKHLHDRQGEKLNLFRRSASNRSSARSSTSTTTCSGGGGGGGAQSGGRRLLAATKSTLSSPAAASTHAAEQQQQTPATLRRKTASLYRFRTASRQLKSDELAAAPASAPATPLGNHDTTTNPLGQTRLGATSNAEPDEQAKAAANHLAYLRARSFIRDKFLQITRQAAADDQRKFSSPNLPLYNAKSGAAAAAAAQQAVNQPKRNVCYHYTIATDTQNIRDLFESLQKMVIKSTIKDL